MVGCKFEPAKDIPPPVGCEYVIQYGRRVALMCEDLEKKRELEAKNAERVAFEKQKEEFRSLTVGFDANLRMQIACPNFNVECARRLLAKDAKEKLEKEEAIRAEESRQAELRAAEAAAKAAYDAPFRALEIQCEEFAAKNCKSVLVSKTDCRNTAHCQYSHGHSTCWNEIECWENWAPVCKSSAPKGTKVILGDTNNSLKCEVDGWNK
jgi:hypothetical protein